MVRSAALTVFAYRRHRGQCVVQDQQIVAQKDSEKKKLSHICQSHMAKAQHSEKAVILLEMIFNYSLDWQMKKKNRFKNEVFEF